MRKSTPIDYLGRGLHQDCGVGVTSLEEMAANVLAFLTDAEKAELLPYLTAQLATLTSSELKGLLNRASDAVRFPSQTARAFLEAVAAHLQT